MDWVFLILILAFIAWCVQILYAYRRQADRIQIQIDQVLASEAEVSEQADQYEDQAVHKEGTFERA